MTKRSPCYIGKLGFTLVEDSYQPDEDKRWVTIRPPGAPENAAAILLARAASCASHSRTGLDATTHI